MLHNILFTHDDLDGAGCRILFHLHFTTIGEYNKDYAIVNCSNKNVDEMVLKELDKDSDKRVMANITTIWFADIVPSREVLQRLKDEKYVVHIYDHHRTNFFVQWELAEPSFAVIIPEKETTGRLESGTSLLYSGLCTRLRTGMFNHADQKLSTWVSKLVDTIRSYDTFEFKETNNMEAKKLQMFFQFIGMDLFCSRYVERIFKWYSEGTDYIPDSVILADRDLAYVINGRIDKEQAIIDEITPENVYDLTIDNYKCAFSLPVMGTNVSELAYQFLRKYPEYDIYIMFSWSNGGEFSFRTAKEDIDCGKFAEQLGGGGHPKASGCPIPDEMRHDMFCILWNFLSQSSKYI